MIETGEKLKQTREEKGISLEEVVLATKIKLSTLKAIETGDLSKLPSRTFIRGFVQSYARYLQADEAVVLEIFNREMGDPLRIKKNVQEIEENSQTDKNAMKFANSTRHPLIKIFVGLGAVVLVVMIYFISSTIDKYQEEKQLVIPTQEEAQNIVPLDNSEDIEKPTVPEEKQLADQKPIEQVEDSNKPEKVAGKEDAKKEAVKEKEKVVNATAPEKKITKEVLIKESNITKVEPKKEEPVVVEPVKAEAVKPEKKLEKLMPKKHTASFIPQEVIIEALDQVKIDFKTDSNSWVSIELKPEQIHTVKGRHLVSIKASDGGAINLIHNGQDKGVPGNLGSKIEIKFPK